MISVRDISERKAHTQALEYLALHDGLTGLANRTMFGDLMSRELSTAKRNAEERAVLVMDLDGFKNVNDTLGHDRGDTLLKQVTKRLLATLREGDTVARLGGDEFGILPTAPPTSERRRPSRSKSNRYASEAFTWVMRSSTSRRASASPLYPRHGSEAVELLHRADLAMYSAKRSGEGHAVFDEAKGRTLPSNLPG